MESKALEIKRTSDVFKSAIEEMGSTTQSTRLPGWCLFNEITGGLRPREFSILCGSTGSGKTSWLANMSAQLGVKGVPHFVVNVETGPVDFMKRVLSVLERRDLNTGDPIPPDDIMRIAMNHADLMLREHMWFSTAEDRTDHKLLMDHLRKVADLGCKVAFIDNLNFLMEVVSSHNQIAEMDRVTHDLIMLTKEIDLHVVMVMHPKKTDGGRVESEFDIKGSSTAVQEAHNVLLFNRLDRKDPAYSPYARELKIAKLRKRGAYVGQVIRYTTQGPVYIEERTFRP